VTSHDPDRPFDGRTNAHDEPDQRKTWMTPRVLLSEIERQTNKSPLFIEYTLGPDQYGPS
jgi:hypothetical protein